jgi:ATP-dependent Clp protease, protease subunit
MKVRKLVLGLIVALGVVFYPTYSQEANATVSKDEVITLSTSNLIVLNSEINGDSVGAVVIRARELDNTLSQKLGLANKDPIYLYLTTPGGEVEAGLQMLEALKGLHRPVDTITAFSASMGFQTVQALGTRYILRSGKLMSHRAAGGFEGQFGGTAHSQLDNRYSFYLRILKEMDEATVARTKGRQTLQSYQKAYENELWLTGAEAVAQGYADKVVIPRCDDSLSGTTSKTGKVLIFDVSYEVDNCPINSSPMNLKVTMPGLNGSSLPVDPAKLPDIKTQFFQEYNTKTTTPVPFKF